MNAAHPKCLDDTVDFSVWLLETIAKFDRAHRFSVGERLAGEAIDFAMDVQQAAFGIDELGSLRRAGEPRSALLGP